MPNQIVAYYRVSTARQGASGLGLAAQRAAVEAYCKAHGANVAQEFTEIESGKNNDRRVLGEAITFARRSHLLLVIAKLDRLARNVAFIANLLESGVEFAACDLPEANRLLLHVMAAIAEYEARAISDRTVQALAAARKRGTPLGAMNPRSRNLKPEQMAIGRARGAESTRTRARAFYAEVEPLIHELRDQGKTLAQVAQELSKRGHFLRSGRPWNAVQVLRVLERSAQPPRNVREG
jgi:DNA invertase Pin-like site-specific DNA recombinase